MGVEEPLEFSSALDVVLLASSNQDHQLYWGSSWLMSSWEKNQDLRFKVTICHQRGQPVLSQLVESSCLKWRNSTIMEKWLMSWSLMLSLVSLHSYSHWVMTRKTKKDSGSKVWSKGGWSHYSSTLRGTSRHLGILKGAGRIVWGMKMNEMLPHN